MPIDIDLQQAQYVEYIWELCSPLGNVFKVKCLIDEMSEGLKNDSARGVQIGRLEAQWPLSVANSMLTLLKSRLEMPEGCELLRRLTSKEQEAVCISVAFKYMVEQMDTKHCGVVEARNIKSLARCELQLMSEVLQWRMMSFFGIKQTTEDQAAYAHTDVIAVAKEHMKHATIRPAKRSRLQKRYNELQLLEVESPKESSAMIRKHPGHTDVKRGVQTAVSMTQDNGNPVSLRQLARTPFQTVRAAVCDGPYHRFVRHGTVPKEIMTVPMIKLPEDYTTTDPEKLNLPRVCAYTKLDKVRFCVRRKQEEVFNWCDLFDFDTMTKQIEKETNIPHFLPIETKACRLLSAEQLLHIGTTYDLVILFD